MAIKTNKEIYRADEAYEILVELQKNKPVIAFKSMIPSLDKYVQDFRGGELTVLSGKTGHGKSTLAITLTKNMADNGYNALWFSYEMGTLEFLEKTRDEKMNFPIFYLPLYLIPNKLDYIEYKLKEAKKIVDISAIFIDHLHYLCDLSDVRLTVEIGRVMRWLKTTAVKYNVAVFVIAHVMKLSDFKISEIDNDHLKDASAVAQEADNVFFIMRPDDSNKAILKITKNRRNGYRNKKINLVKIGNYLRDEDEINYSQRS